MAYVTIPKDLSRIQSKVLFGLTKRQVICFAAALIGVFFWQKAWGPPRRRLHDSGDAALFPVRHYEEEREPLEVFLGPSDTNSSGRRCASTRPNLYSALVRQSQLGEADCEKAKKA